MSAFKNFTAIDNKTRITPCEYEIMVNYSQDPFFLINVNKNDTFSFLRVNLAFEKIIACSSEEMRGKSIEGFFKIDYFKKCVAEKDKVKYRDHIHFKKRNTFYIINLTPIIEEEKVIKILGTCINIIKEQEIVYNIFDSMNQYVFINSWDYKINFLNKKAKEEFGDLTGKTCFKEISRNSPCVQCPIYSVLNDVNDKPIEYTVEAFGKILKGTATTFNNTTGGFLVLEILEDITEQKMLEENLKFMSYHDSLTGLYNRNFIKEEMKRLDTKRQLPISIIMGDINGLKLVNDSFGHEKGDQLIISAASTIKNSCRQEDIVSRWSGDEFVVLLPKTDKKSVRRIVKRIKDDCSKNTVDNVPLSLAFGHATKMSFLEKDLYSLLKEAEDYMYKNKLTEKKSVRGQLLSTLISTLEAKSDETIQHSMRMVKLSFMLGEKLNLSSHQLDKLSILASLHDIGKIGIDEHILKKPTSLNKKEWDIVKKHPKIGYNILSSSEEFSYVAEEVYAHHERWDGTGYPQGLKGKKIPLLSRIIFIIDTYDIITNGRPYKKPFSVQEALLEIKRNAGSQFDPGISKVFIELIEEF